MNTNARVALALLIALPVAARASTAANTSITNTVSVAYNDAGGNVQTPVTASATITVTLVPAAPLLSSPVATSVNQGQSVVLTYTITGTANGPDTYAITSAATPTNLSAVTPAPPANFTLGGTTLAAAAAAGNTSITVPYDGVAANTSLNGLAPGNTIVIGGNAYVIAANGIVKNAGANTATLTLTSPITGAAVPAGAIVGQQATFTVTVPSGAVVAGSSGSESVSTTATSTTSAAAATTQSSPTVITVNRAVLTVAKLVSTDGTTFGASGNAPPGTQLTYKIVITNTGATSATSVAITDALPLFLTYVAGSGRTATSVATTYAAAAPLTDNAGGFTVSGTAPTNLAYAAGTLGSGAANVLVLFYKAQIN